MPTRSSQNWATHPGNFDKLNTFARFPSRNAWGIPDLIPYPGPTPAYLRPYGQRVRTTQPTGPGCYHFFLDDYRIEPAWHRPHATLHAVQAQGCALTPDFSVYTDWPAALGVWNTYRTRWCGAFWQAEGVQVIPTVSWSTPASFTWAFLGLPVESVLAISSQSTQQRTGGPLPAHYFATGYRAMCAALRPRLVLCYGPLPAPLQALAPYVEYPTLWAGITPLLRAQK